MSWKLQGIEAADIARIDAALREWEPLSGCASGFASGDLGWELRYGADAVARDLRCWIGAGGTIGAIGQMEDAATLWLTIDPARLMDGDLAEAIVRDAVSSGLTSIGAPSVPALIRSALGRRGFALHPEPWLYFWKPLTDDDIIEVPGVLSTLTPDLIEQRIAVKQSAFDDSTFTLEQWHCMATGPSFRPELDVVALNDAWIGVSALTAWMPDEGKCGVIKAMGTHADYRRQGHGRRVLQASFAALRRLGASGVRVFADRGDEAATVTYRAVGFQVIGYDTEMVRRTAATALTR